VPGKQLTPDSADGILQRIVKEGKGSPMADIISIEEKIRLSEKQKAEIIKRQKIMAVRKVFQCTHCLLKCEKCGTQMDAPSAGQAAPKHVRIPYRFCESCSEEYIDYIDRLHGKGDPDCYWRNDLWLQSWKAWIDYQGAMDRYLKSREFVKLLNELRQINPHE
jgi:hypothetical protein